MNTEAVQQTKFAVLSFRVMPRGAFKWAHGGRRGYYRVQINTVDHTVPVNSPKCLRQISGRVGLELAGARSAYCLSDDYARLAEIARKLNAQFAIEAQAN